MTKHHASEMEGKEKEDDAYSIPRSWMDANYEGEDALFEARDWEGIGQEKDTGEREEEKTGREAEEARGERRRAGGICRVCCGARVRARVCVSACCTV